MYFNLGGEHAAMAATDIRVQDLVVIGQVDSTFFKVEDGTLYQVLVGFLYN